MEKREIDFGHEKKIYYLQKIVISNDKSKKLSTELVANRIGNKKVDLNDNLEVTTTKYFNEAKFQALVETHFGKAIKKVEKKLSAGTLSQVRFGFELLSSLSSEEKLIKFLKGYHLLPDSINSFAQVETILNKTVSSLITKESILEFLDSIDKISEFYTNEIYQNLLDSNKFYSDIIYDFESFKDRLQIFDLLYEAKVLESGIYKTFYECYNCDEGVFKSITTLIIIISCIIIPCNF